MTPPLYAAAYLRSIVVQALVNAQGAGALAANITSPGIWDAPETKLPAVTVRHGDQLKRGTEQTAPLQVHSIISIEIQAQCRGATGVIAQSAMELLAGAVEYAIFSQIFALDLAFCAANGAPEMRVIERFEESRQRIEITADSTNPLASLDMTMVFRLFQPFDPAGPPLTTIGGTLTDPDSGDVQAIFSLPGLNT